MSKTRLFVVGRAISRQPPSGRLLLGLISCTICLNGAIQPDTARLAQHLERFRGRKVYEMRAAEHKAVQLEYLTWIDARIKARAEFGQMNEELRAANLLSDGPHDIDDMFDKNYAGFLGKVEDVPVRGADLLAVKFGVHTGGYCNFEETVVLYRREPFQRLAILNAERSYSHGYHLRELAIGEEAGHARLLASAWVASNCTSNWNGNIFRIDRLRADNSLESILNQGVSSFLDDQLKISIEEDTVTFEFTTSMGDRAVLTREAVTRYLVQGRHITRLAPIAPSFGGFLREWLDLSDTEASRWSSSEASVGHHNVTAKFKKQIFTFQSVAECPGSPPTREIAVQLDESKQTVVFLISGSSAEEMRMVAVMDQPPSGCRQIDISNSLTSILSQPPRGNPARP